MKGNSKKISGIPNPPKIAVKISNAVFIIGIIYSVLLTMYGIYKIVDPSKDETRLMFYFAYILIAVITATLFYLGLRMLSDKLKMNVSLLIITSSISIYTIEFFLEFQRIKEIKPRATIAEEQGIPFDTRTKMEVLVSLNNNGIETYPNVYPSLFRTTNGLNGSEGNIYPLGGISNTKAILNNELGFFPIINTDKYGFNNPKGLYKNSKIDMVLIGDSFTEGYSVQSDKNIAEVIRKTGFNIVNLGRGGNGPLTELAILKEYAEPLRPRIVLWLYVVNDYGDLHYEMNSSILMSYLNLNNYSQQLISKQDEIDNLLKSYVSDEQETFALNWKPKKERVDYLKMFVLTNFRIMLKLIIIKLNIMLEEPTMTPVKKYVSSTPILFKQILSKASDMVAKWEGMLYFVYLPTFDRYTTGSKDFLKIEHEFRNEIINFMKDNDVPIIDMHKEVFSKHPNVQSLFPFTLGGHYNDEGYRLVAEAIVKRINSDGFVSSHPTK